MRAVVTGVIAVYGASPNEVRVIKDHLSIDDPEYHKKLRINPSARFYLSPQFKFYEEKAGVITIPRGAGRWLQETFPQTVFEDKTVSSPFEFDVKEPIVLRQNQEGIPEAITQSKQGLAVLPTGFGKTIIALRVAQLLKQHTLVLVPTSPIREQFCSDIKRYFGFDASKEDSPIFVCTTRYVVSRGTRGSFAGERFGLVIYDECDGSVADGAQKVWRYLPARYRYGFTGTLDRTDGKGPAIPFLFGQVLVERHQTLATPDIFLHQFNGGGAIDIYHKMTEELAENDERNEAIAGLVEQGKKTLILTKRVEHYKLLAAKLPKNLRIHAIDAQGKAAERKFVLDSLRKGELEYDVVLGTYSLLGRGLDIPSLDVLILAGDLKSSVLQKQAAGRILRLFGDKKPVIHDIVDVNNPILYRQARARQSVYTKLGWPTQVCPMKNATQSLFPKNIERLFATTRT